MYTEEHRLGLKLYLSEIKGNLPPTDEPADLLPQPVQRGLFATEKKEK
jgi:hypothetical protein